MPSDAYFHPDQAPERMLAAALTAAVRAEQWRREGRMTEGMVASVLASPEMQAIKEFLRVSIGEGSDHSVMLCGPDFTITLPPSVVQWVRS